MPLSIDEQNAIWGSKGASLKGRKLPDKYSVLEPEEKLIINECQDEAFWYRCAPLTVCFSLGTHILHERGMLEFHLVPRPAVKLGLLGVAGVMGYLVGQYSYSNVCRDKFLARVPNGVIATDIRMKYGFQPYPYSIFSPINQEKWRQLAKERELNSLREKFEPGFEIDDEFKDQNVLSPNLLNDSRISHHVGPVRYGVFMKTENEESDS